MVDERRSRKNGGLGRKRPREGKAKDSDRGGGGGRNRKGGGVARLPDHPHKVCIFFIYGFLWACERVYFGCIWVSITEPCCFVIASSQVEHA